MPPVDYALLPEVVVQFKSGKEKGERGGKGGRNEMEISHKAWLTSTCGGASAFGAAITIFVAAVGVASMRAGGGGVARPFHSHNCTSRPKESQGKRG